MGPPALASLALCAALAGAPAATARPKAPAQGAAGKTAPEEPAARAGARLAARVQKAYARALDFSARFQQAYEYVAFGRTDRREGRVWVKRPGLLRWEYDAPEKKVIVLDGKDLWTHVPEDQSVIVQRGFTGSELSSAFTFLWGKGDLTAEFAPTSHPLPPDLPAGEGLLLTPRKPGAVQRLLFSVAKDGTVLASVVTDSQGNVNTLVFSDAKVDLRPAPALFRFEPPAGIPVQELPARR